jgi:hypothetical protein
MEPPSIDSIRQFYFFIGRTTPPHFGHIHVLRQTIDLARASGTCALILLGNGPNGGMRTNENPVEHETKAAFLIHKLTQLSYEEGTHFIIQMMKNPPNHQVVDFIVKRIPENVSQISIFQVAGNKDDDVLKHNFVRRTTCKTLQEMYNPEEKMFNCGFVAVDPATGGTAELGMAMSATKVRNKAVECYERSGNNLNDAFLLWLEAFPFYSNVVKTDETDDTEILSKQIFHQIIRYKDTKPITHTSVSKTKKRPEPPLEEGGPTFVNPKKSKKGPGQGGSRRKHTRRRRVSKLRNKKTLRNIRRRR